MVISFEIIQVLWVVGCESGYEGEVKLTLHAGHMPGFGLTLVVPQVPSKVPKAPRLALAGCVKVVSGAQGATTWPWRYGFYPYLISIGCCVGFKCAL